jgi:hypothetical protein
VETWRPFSFVPSRGQITGTRRTRVSPRNTLLAHEHLAPYCFDGTDVQAGTRWAAWSHIGVRPRGSRACWCVRRPRAASPCTPPCPPRCWRPGAGTGLVQLREVHPGHQGGLQGGGHPSLHPGKVPALLRRHLSHRERGESGFSNGLHQPQEPDHHTALLRDARCSNEGSHLAVKLVFTASWLVRTQDAMTVLVEHAPLLRLLLRPKRGTLRGLSYQLNVVDEPTSPIRVTRSLELKRI